MTKEAKTKPDKKTKNKVLPAEKDTVEDNFKLHKQLKTSSYSSSLIQIRKRLPKKKQKAFSHVIHAKGMDSSNDFIANTIARPNSIIGGSLLALVGVLVGVFLSRYYGYSYNYLLLFLLFILGYVIELLIESVIKFFVRYKD